MTLTPGQPNFQTKLFINNEFVDALDGARGPPVTFGHANVRAEPAQDGVMRRPAIRGYPTVGARVDPCVQ